MRRYLSLTSLIVSFFSRRKRRRKMI